MRWAMISASSRRSATSSPTRRRFRCCLRKWLKHVCATVVMCCLIVSYLSIAMQLRHVLFQLAEWCWSCWWEMGAGKWSFANWRMHSLNQAIADLLPLSWSRYDGNRVAAFFRQQSRKQYVFNHLAIWLIDEEVRYVASWLYHLSNGALSFLWWVWLCSSPGVRLLNVVCQARRNNHIIVDMQWN